MSTSAKTVQHQNGWCQIVVTTTVAPNSPILFRTNTLIIQQVKAEGFVPGEFGFLL